MSKLGNHSCSVEILRKRLFSDHSCFINLNVPNSVVTDLSIYKTLTEAKNRCRKIGNHISSLGIELFCNVYVT